MSALGPAHVRALQLEVADPEWDCEDGDPREADVLAIVERGIAVFLPPTEDAPWERVRLNDLGHVAARVLLPRL